MGSVSLSPSKNSTYPRFCLLFSTSFQIRFFSMAWTLQQMNMVGTFLTLKITFPGHHSILAALSCALCLWKCSQVAGMQFLVPEHTFFFLLRAWCAGGLIAGLLSDGDGSDKTGFPAQALLLFLLLQVLEDMFSSLMGT